MSSATPRIMKHEDGVRPPITTPLDGLRRAGLFERLDDSELRRLAARFSLDELPELTLVYRHGDTADFFYVVLAGDVSIYRDETGRPLQLLARLGPGDYFGETGLFDGYRRSSSARTRSATRVAKIAKHELLSFLAANPEVEVKLQIAAARRHSENVAAALDLGERRDVRIRLGKHVSIGLEGRAGGEVVPGVLENLSVGGLCLRGVPAAWSEGDAVRFRLAFLSDELAVAARISWREEDRAGLAFLTVDPEHDRRVESFLRSVLH